MQAVYIFYRQDLISIFHLNNKTSNVKYHIWYKYEVIIESCDEISLTIYTDMVKSIKYMHYVKQTNPITLLFLDFN